MATIRYRWREANGDEGYDHSDWEHQDDCSYCGAPPIYQHATWSEECVPESGQCPQCGATGLYPLQQSNRRERKMMTEQRINAVANLLIQAVEVFINPCEASDQALVAAAHGLDRDAASMLTNLGKGLLQLSGSEEEASDAKD